MTTIADLFGTVAYQIFGGSAFIALAGFVICIGVFLALHKLGIPGALLIFNVLGFGLFTFGAPWNGVEYGIIAFDGVVVALAAIQLAQR